MAGKFRFQAILRSFCFSLQLVRLPNHLYLHFMHTICSWLVRLLPQKKETSFWQLFELSRSCC